MNYLEKLFQVTLLSVSESESLTDKDLIKYSENDIFNSNTAIALCASKNFKSNTGFAKEVNLKYEVVPSLRKQNKSVGDCIVLSKERSICYLITKHKPSDKASYETFKKSLLSLKQKCFEYGIKELAFAKYGCGLDKLDWSKVKRMINEILCKNGINCIVHTKTFETLNNINCENELSIDRDIKRIQHKDVEIKKLIDKAESNKLKGFLLEKGALFKLRRARRNKV